MIDKFPPIFDICNCGDCSEIVWGGRKFINGHNRKNFKYSDASKEKMKKSAYARSTKDYRDKISNSVKLSWENDIQRKENFIKNNPMKKTENIVKFSGENNPMKRPEIAIKISGKGNGMYGRPPIRSKGCYYKGSHYDSLYQGKIWLRSSYELAYAKYLDSINEIWYYEIKTFDLENMTYTPDFFLPRENKFIEIKGYMNDISLIKITKFLEQYNENFEILYKEDLIKLGIKL